MRIVAVRPEARYRVWLSFDDGTEGVVDLGDLAGKGVFAAWGSGDAFEGVTVGSGGELAWACGVDLCADALYLRLTGKSPEDIFPSLAPPARCA